MFSVAVFMLPSQYPISVATYNFAPASLAGVLFLAGFGWLLSGQLLMLTIQMLSRSNIGDQIHQGTIVEFSQTDVAKSGHLLVYKVE